MIVANGTVAGVTGGQDPADGGWTFSSMLGPYLVHGANEIDAYEVTAGRRALRCSTGSGRAGNAAAGRIVDQAGRVFGDDVREGTCDAQLP